MRRIFSFLFLVSLVAYFIFAASEEFVPGFVSDYFNVHLLLIPTVIFLTASLLLQRGAHETHERSASAKGDVPLVLLAAFATVGILFVSMAEVALGWRILVSVYGGMLVAGMLSVVLKD